jgi:hypothetical protein
MLRPGRILGLTLLLAAALLLPTCETVAQSPAKPSTASAGTPLKSKRHAKTPAPVAEVPQAPPPPPTLEQQAPAAPQVTYRDGQLTINSTNATLSQVLHSVQTQTGAIIDIPPGAGSERVVANLGPGKPQAVLAILLNGSKFNYVILGESNNPGAVQKVILLAKSNSSGSEPASVTAQNNSRTPPPQAAVEPPEDEYPQNEPEAENPSPLVPGQPGMPGSENLQPEVIQPGNRTPEQMLQELQRMQQQQQQMQQQLNPANQQPLNQQNPPSTPLPSQPLAARPQPQ